MGYPFNISAIAKASDFNFGMQLGFVKAHYKIAPRRKVCVALGYGTSPKFVVPFYISVMVEASDLKCGIEHWFAKFSNKNHT